MRICVVSVTDVPIFKVKQMIMSKEKLITLAL